MSGRVTNQYRAWLVEELGWTDQQIDRLIPDNDTAKRYINEQRRPPADSNSKSLNESSAKFYAFACIKRGWAVFPCWWIEDGRCACRGIDGCSPGKHPIADCAPFGVNQATTHLQIVNNWWTKYPRANVAIATGRSGLIILDLDPRHGADEQAVIAKIGPVETVRVLTGGGGLHLWFKAPPGGYAPSAGKFLPGIDIRAGNSYAIIPPSSHISGGAYEFEVGHGPADIEVALCPPVLADFARIDKSSGNGAASNTSDAGNQDTGFNVLRALAGVAKGERNDAIFRAACSFRGSNTAKKVALQACLDAAAQCAPPYCVRKFGRSSHGSMASIRRAPDQRGAPTPTPRGSFWTGKIGQSVTTACWASRSSRPKSTAISAASSTCGRRRWLRR
jgi:hypothetical protein